GGGYFARAQREFPLSVSQERFSWGVWSSLSEKSFRRMLALWDDPRRELEPPYFGWFSTVLPTAIYPDTLNLKANVYEQAPGERPLIVLWDSEKHPLAVDQREGITVERAREIALVLLKEWGGSAV